VKREKWILDCGICAIGNHDLFSVVKKVILLLLYAACSSLFHVWQKSVKKTKIEILGDCKSVTIHSNSSFLCRPCALYIALTMNKFQNNAKFAFLE